MGDKDSPRSMGRLGSARTMQVHLLFDIILSIRPYSLYDISKS